MVGRRRVDGAWREGGGWMMYVRQFMYTVTNNFAQTAIQFRALQLYIFLFRDTNQIKCQMSNVSGRENKLATDSKAAENE